MGFFPGEIEDRQRAGHLVQGISMADTTWQGLLKLGALTNTLMPPASSTSQAPAGWVGGGS